MLINTIENLLNIFFFNYFFTTFSMHKLYSTFIELEAMCAVGRGVSGIFRILLLVLFVLLGIPL